MSINETKSRVESIRHLSSNVSTMISMMEIYNCRSLESVLREYRFSTDHLLAYMLDPRSDGQLVKAETHIRQAYRIAAKNVMLAIYRHYEANYSKLLLLSKLTGVGRANLHRVRSEMDSTQIAKRISDLYQIGNFDEYLNKTGKVLIDFVDLSRQLSEVLSECEQRTWYRARNLAYKIGIVIAGIALGIFLATHWWW